MLDRSGRRHLPQWHAKDRLVACITPDHERWVYGYDPFGRRIHKIHSPSAKANLKDKSGQPTQEQLNRGAYSEDDRDDKYRATGSEPAIVGTSYLWDGNVIAEEAPLRVDGSTDWDNATRWHFEPDSFKPIAKESPDGTLTYIVCDHLGTPREMFSEDGEIVWAAEYRTWGALRRIWKADNDNTEAQGPYPPAQRGLTLGNLALRYAPQEHAAAQDCPIRFQGQWEDAETGLYYNRFRYCDPLAGQYLSQDPIGLAGGTRPQGYVHNPSAWIDPWGLAKKKNCCDEDKLSTDNPVPKDIKKSYEDIITGKGTPRIDPRTGQQTIHQGREQPGWSGAREWDISGTNNRILERTLPNGQTQYGYVTNHNYNIIKIFPSPWYPDGGKR